MIKIYEMEPMDFVIFHNHPKKFEHEQHQMQFKQIFNLLGMRQFSRNIHKKLKCKDLWWTGEYFIGLLMLPKYLHFYFDSKGGSS